ncbi:MAG: OmpP1/FadL family transporter, partial [Thiogranum sp.]
MRRSKVKLTSLRLLGAGILTACTSTGMASGFALIEQSASQMGNAFAGGSAVANDASTIYFNPAGMTRLKTQAVAGTHLVITSAKFDGTGTDPAGFPTSGGNGGDAGGNGVVPNLYFSTPLGDGLFAGIGINVPFGLSTEYDDGWKGRYQAIESEVKTININPSMAYQINNRLSVGVGVSLQYIDAKLTQNIDQGSLCVPTQAQLQALGVPGADPANCAGLVPQGSDGFAKVEGDNWAGGYNLGLLYEPTSSTRVGL